MQAWPLEEQRVEKVKQKNEVSDPHKENSSWMSIEHRKPATASPPPNGGHPPPNRTDQRCTRASAEGSPSATSDNQEQRGGCTQAQGEGFPMKVKGGADPNKEAGVRREGLGIGCRGSRLYPDRLP